MIRNRLPIRIRVPKPQDAAVIASYFLSPDEIKELPGLFDDIWEARAYSEHTYDFTLGIDSWTASTKVPDH